MTKLQEIFDSDFYLLTEKSQLPKYALGKLSYNFAKADEQNLNYRIYPEKLMIREINKKSEELKKAKIAGQLDHPLSGVTQLDSAMHILNSVSYDKDTKLASAESFILDTTGGRNFMTLLDAKIPIGASMRSWGTIGSNKEINPDWNFLSIDFVQNPSFGANATIDKSNLIESVDSLTEKEAPSEEMLRYIKSRIYVDGKESGSKKSFEEFLKEDAIAIEAGLKVEQGIYDSIEEALIQMNEEATLRKMKSEEKVKIWNESEIFWEARTAGVSPKEFARKLNEVEKRKQIDRDSGFSKEIAANLISEAEAAGVKDLKNPEKRAEFFEKMKETVTPSEKTLHEKALGIQKRLLSEGKKADDLDFIKAVLIHDEKKAEIQEKRMAVKAMVESEMVAAGAYTSHEEMHKHVNRELRKRGLKPLNEDGQ